MTLRRLCALLDPVLVPRGFQAGQGATEGATGQVIWCTPVDELRARCPEHPLAAARSDPTAPAGCVDLVVDVSDGELVRVELEGVEVPGTSALLGHRVDETGAALARAVARHLS